jgi:hypothetical protein
MWDRNNKNTACPETEKVSMIIGLKASELEFFDQMGKVELIPSILVLHFLFF